MYVYFFKSLIRRRKELEKIVFLSVVCKYVYKNFKVEFKRKKSLINMILT